MKHRLLLPLIYVAKAVDLLTDIVFHSTYPQTEIDKEVEVICDEIDSYYDSPAELIYDEFENIAFHDHPLGHNILGTSERVRSFTTEDALRFTRKFYRPENAIFFSYGDVDFKRLVKLLETRNRDVARGEVILERTLHAPTPPLAQTTIREMHTHQAHVMMGCLAYDIHHDYRIPLYLLNNILGGPNMNAKLNLALRERRGLVYTVESMATYYSDTGLWSVYFGCDPHDVEKCCKLVRKELNLVKKKVMSDVQLKAAQQQIKGQIGVACDHRLQFALDFGKNFLLYGWEKDINSLFQQIDNVTAEDIDVVYMITTLNSGTTKEIMLSNDTSFVGPKLFNKENRLIIDGKSYTPDDIQEIRFEKRTIDAIVTVESQVDMRNKDNAVYNLNGQKVCDIETFESQRASLPKGIYVINGKKFIKK